MAHVTGWVCPFGTLRSVMCHSSIFRASVMIDFRFSSYALQPRTLSQSRAADTQVQLARIRRAVDGRDETHILPTG